MNEHSGRDLEELVGQAADDFLDRLNRGETPRIEEYTRKYPEAASVLRQVLPGLLELGGHSAVESEGGSGAAESGPSTNGMADLLSGTLGDFRLVREVGRGGMAVVYEARQISLDRRVALKVLPFAATMDPRQLQRFHNEARAAAGLHHTNMVPVHFVGCERGVHFYAMQFIDGQTLAQVIESLRQQAGPKQARSPEPQPTAPCAPSADTAPLAAQSTQIAPRGKDFFRKAAQLGIQAAEALDHAHQVGVLHRDVKPGNLLLDAAGQLWITDFGVAQVQSDARLTLTGDLDEGRQQAGRAIAREQTETKGPVRFPGRARYLAACEGALAFGLRP